MQSRNLPALAARRLMTAPHRWALRSFSDTLSTTSLVNGTSRSRRQSSLASYVHRSRTRWKSSGSCTSVVFLKPTAQHNVYIFPSSRVVKFLRRPCQRWIIGTLLVTNPAAAASAQWPRNVCSLGEIIRWYSRMLRRYRDLSSERKFFYTLAVHGETQCFHKLR